MITTQVTVRLDPALAKRFRRIAKERCLTMGALLCLGLNSLRDVPPQDLFLEVHRDTETRSKQRAAKGRVVLAFEDPDAYWVPILFQGRRDAIRSRDLRQIPPASKSTAAKARKKG